MTIMMTRLLACAALVLIWLSAAAVMAAPVTLKSGETATLLAPVPADAKLTQGANGKAKIVPATPAGTFKLDYTANTTNTQLTDKVVYEVTGQPPTTIDITIEPSPAAPGFTGEVYEQAGRAVFLLFVLAVILESALALLFNWKPFVENLVPRAVRPLIAFFAAILVVNLLGLDVVAALANALNTTKLPISTTGQVLTALVVAGGSAGVNTMLVALGFRSVKTPETAAPKPPPEKAWLAVRALNGNSRGDLFVFLTSPPGGSNALLGVIKGRSKPNSILSWFVSDRGRLPNYGGHTVQPGQAYAIEVRGKDANGVPLPPVTYGPLEFAKGAVVDIDVKL
jgi:hypothetical protein